MFLGAYPTPAGRAIGSSPAPGSSAGVDEYREVAFEVSGAGVLEFTVLRGKRNLASVPVAGLDGSRVTGMAGFGKGRYVIGTSDGRVIPLEMRFEVVFKDGKRTVTPQPVFGAPSALDPANRRPIIRLASASPESGAMTVAQVGPAELLVQTVVAEEGTDRARHARRVDSAS